MALAFLIVALVLAILAAANFPSSRVGLFPLAFAFYIASLLVGRI